MKVLYVGQYSAGTTSKMRADHIKLILKPSRFDIIDTHIPFYQTPRIPRSVGFRFKVGPLVSNINNYVNIELDKLSDHYDLIWVDKGILVNLETISKLKNSAGKLVHYTPDMAFFENRSIYFEKSINTYAFLITTKSAEIEKYKELVSIHKIVKTTQGFSKDKHFPTTQFENKEDSVAFIGLAEKHRFELIEHLINNNIHVKVAGMGWKKFVKKNLENPFLNYYGNGIYGEDYSKFISSSKFGLGALSKRFPEFHTTRTFEIPACGTALLTEKNQETSSFFKDDEVIFYSSKEEIVEKINYYFNHQDELKKVTKKGLDRVNTDGYDYESILNNILNKIEI